MHTYKHYVYTFLIHQNEESKMAAGSDLTNQARQDVVNSERLKLYLHRRETYLRFSGEGFNVTFPLVPTSNEINRYV